MTAWPGSADLRPETVLFDLDGTLSDSGAGILESLRYALARNGLAPLDSATERAILGPPLRESLPPLVGGAEPFAAVLAAFREHQSAGARFRTRAYDGVIELLAGLHARDVRLAVASSKPEAAVRQVVEHLQLAGYFETVGGDTPDGSRGKADVIRAVLDRLGAPDPPTVLMVGDRSNDVIGAHAHGIACVGAGWGYGLPGELAAAGADHVCATPREVGELLGVHAGAAAS